MDAERFDRLARSLTTRSRRGFSRALAGITLAGGLATLPGLAAGKKKGNKKKKKCKGKKKCGKKCIPKSACCTDTDCAEGESCCSGQCSPPVFCGSEKTCGCDEICRVGGGNYTCHHRACPDFNYCNESGSYTCGVCDANACCVCATSFDGVNGCVDRAGFAPLPQGCGSDDDCTEALGQPALCIPGGPDCSGGSKSICAPLCTGGLPRRAAGQSGRAQASTLKLGK